MSAAMEVEGMGGATEVDEDHPKRLTATERAAEEIAAKAAAKAFADAEWPTVDFNVLYAVKPRDSNGDLIVDGEESTVMLPKGVIPMCSSLFALVETCPPEDDVTIPMVFSALDTEKSNEDNTSDTLGMADVDGEAQRLRGVVEYFDTVKQDGRDDAPKHKEDRMRLQDTEEAFFAKFGGDGVDYVIRILRLSLLANYLGYEQLLYACLCATGRKISAATPLEVCKMFGRDTEITAKELEGTYQRMPFLRPPAAEAGEAGEAAAAEE